MLHDLLLMRTSGAFLVMKSVREKSYTHHHRHSHGSGPWEPLKNRSPTLQQLSAMQTDVAELHNALQGSAKIYAEFMVQWFTSEARVRKVMEVGDQRAVMSRLQVVETRRTGAMTSVAQRFRGKEATECKPH